MITGGGAFGGIFSGLITKSNSDWRWVFWMDTILTGACLLLVIFFLPETSFRRPADFENGEDSEMTLAPVTTVEHKSNLGLQDALTIFRWYDRCVH